jgi:hypothetical protein
MKTRLKKEVEALFRPLLGQKTWGVRQGWGSFVTLEFGLRHLEDRHFHGEWHLWLYQCDWMLRSQARPSRDEMANSESKRGLIPAAVGNLNGLELSAVSFDPDRMATDFVFQGDLHLICWPYPDAKSDEECWMLFLPDKQVASLVDGVLNYEPATRASERAVTQ